KMFELFRTRHQQRIGEGRHDKVLAGGKASHGVVSLLGYVRVADERRSLTRVGPQPPIGREGEHGGLAVRAILRIAHHALHFGELVRERDDHVVDRTIAEIEALRGDVAPADRDALDAVTARNSGEADAISPWNEAMRNENAVDGPDRRHEPAVSGIK